MILRNSLITQCTCAARLTPRAWVRSMATVSDLASIGQAVKAIDREYHGFKRQKRIEEAQGLPLSTELSRDITPAERNRLLLEEDETDIILAIRKKQKPLSKLGTSIEPHYEPEELFRNPPNPGDITIEMLMAAQAHLGHKTSHWHPGNSQHIFGVRQGVHIISLEATAAHLRRACRVVRGVAERAGLILFVGTRPGQARSVVMAAKRSRGYHLFDKWKPGSLTNGMNMLGNCGLKLVNEFDQEIDGYTNCLEDAAVLKPDLVVVLNPTDQWVLLHECGLHHIPTIGVLDTNCDPTWLTYPIPANDDSLRCTDLIAGVLGKAGQEGQRSRIEMASHGQVPYQGEEDLLSDAAIVEKRDEAKDSI